MNAVFFLNDAQSGSAFVNHAVGCEYDSRFLVRFSFQQVGDSLQGAAYYFSQPDAGSGGNNFVGPISGAVAPNGDIYIGSIFDSGWLGGRNTGAIERLRVNGPPPLGIKELRARPGGFQIEFTGPIAAQEAADAGNYSISGYTRTWKGGYGTNDSERHKVNVTSVKVDAEKRIVRLEVDQLRANFVYEVTVRNLNPSGKKLWPATGHYTMNRVPTKDD